MLRTVLSVTERPVVGLFCDVLVVSIWFRCKLISPSSCTVSLLSRQPPSSAVTYNVATVIRFRDSTNVWNFPFILTGAVELNGYALMCVFCTGILPNCLNVSSLIRLIVEPVSTVNCTF